MVNFAVSPHTHLAQLEKLELVPPKPVSKLANYLQKAKTSGRPCFLRPAAARPKDDRDAICS